MDRLGSDLGELLARLERDGLAALPENAEQDGGAGTAEAGAAAPGDGHGCDPAGNLADVRDLMVLCGRLEPLLKAGNTGTLALLDEIKKAVPPLDEGGKNSVQQLIKQIEDFEFSAALQTLRDLRRNVEDTGGGV
jgi:hypothetical protein